MEARCSEWIWSRAAPTAHGSRGNGTGCGEGRRESASANLPARPCTHAIVNDDSSFTVA